MKHRKRIGYLGIVSILLLTFIPFISRISTLANSHQLSVSHCHQTISVTPEDHPIQHAKHKTNPDSWTSMCDYCELFMQVPVLIYVNIPIVKVFVSIAFVKNYSPNFVIVYHVKRHLIRAPPFV